ncbi:hypothetical protein RCL1_005314 [Eukaryota sp. TZLM3-RCL]
MQFIELPFPSKLLQRVFRLLCSNNFAHEFSTLSLSEFIEYYHVFDFLDICEEATKSLDNSFSIFLCNNHISPQSLWALFNSFPTASSHRLLNCLPCSLFDEVDISTLVNNLCKKSPFLIRSLFLNLSSIYLYSFPQLSQLIPGVNLVELRTNTPFLETYSNSLSNLCKQNLNDFDTCVESLASLQLQLLFDFLSLIEYSSANSKLKSEYLNDFEQKFCQLSTDFSSFSLNLSLTTRFRCQQHLITSSRASFLRFKSLSFAGNDLNYGKLNDQLRTSLCNLVQNSVDFLIVLNLSFNPLRSIGLDALFPNNFVFSKLKFLSLSHCSLGVESIVSLSKKSRKFPQLSVLDVSDNDLKLTGFANLLAKFGTKIKKLYCARCNVMFLKASEVAEFPNKEWSIKFLDVSENFINPLALFELISKSGITTISHLFIGSQTLYRNPLPPCPIFFKNLILFSNLFTLNLNYSLIEVQGCNSLSNLIKNKCPINLSLKGCTLADPFVVIESLIYSGIHLKLPKLLDLSSSNTSDVLSPTVLSSLIHSNLRIIILDYLNISPHHLVSISNSINSSLVCISFIGCKIGGNSSVWDNFGTFISLSCITRLCLSGNRIPTNSSFFSHLLMSPLLNYLDISDNLGGSSSLVQNLAESLPPRLKELNISRLKCKNVNFLFQNFAKHLHLQSIIMDHCSINYSELVSNLMSLSTCKSLKNLSIVGVLPSSLLKNKEYSENLKQNIEKLWIFSLLNKSSLKFINATILSNDFNDLIFKLENEKNYPTWRIHRPQVQSFEALAFDK